MGDGEPAVRRRTELETERTWRLRLARQLETELATLERILGTSRDRMLNVAIATASVVLGVAGLATGITLLTVAGILLGLGGGALVGIDLANKGVGQDRLADVRRELHEQRVQIERIDAELAALAKPENG